MKAMTGVIFSSSATIGPMCGITLPTSLVTALFGPSLKNTPGTKVCAENRQQPAEDTASSASCMKAVNCALPFGVRASMLRTPTDSSRARYPPFRWQPPRFATA